MEQRTQTGTMELEKLDALDDWQLEFESQDIRGRPLVDGTGQRLGTVKEMLVDRDQERVAAIRLDNGQSYPVEALEINDKNVVLTTGRPAPGAGSKPTGDGQRIPVAEERLIIGKRNVEQGHIKVSSRVVEEPVSKDIRLKDERLEVDRRPVNTRAENDSALFKDRTIDVTAMGEEAVVGKETMITEEVTVSKKAGEHTEHVTDTVRKTKVDVDKSPDRKR